jgi:hypothetical protein
MGLTISNQPRNGVIVCSPIIAKSPTSSPFAVAFPLRFSQTMLASAKRSVRG